DFLRVVLDPAVVGEDLRQLALGHRAAAAFGIEDDGARARGALVDRQDAAGRHAFPPRFSPMIEGSGAGRPARWRFPSGRSTTAPAEAGGKAPVISRIGILGAGAWGTALAVIARRAGREVTLWARRPSQAAALAAEGENRLHLPAVALDPAIRVTA